MAFSESRNEEAVNPGVPGEEVDKKMIKLHCIKLSKNL